jgi:hypothetical protein
MARAKCLPGFTYITNTRSLTGLVLVTNLFQVEHLILQGALDKALDHSKTEGTEGQGEDSRDGGGPARRVERRHKLESSPSCGRPGHLGHVWGIRMLSGPNGRGLEHAV